MQGREIMAIYTRIFAETIPMVSAKISAQPGPTRVKYLYLIRRPRRGERIIINHNTTFRDQISLKFWSEELEFEEPDRDRDAIPSISENRS